jgi:alpha-beta hydrolase superfamily lysophospholipase
MKIRKSLLLALAAASAVIALLGSSILFGGPRSLPPLASINNPFKQVDFSDLPPLSRYTARDGTALAYRRYAAPDRAARGSVILIHGSSASSDSMHLMAKAFAQAGYAAYSLDMRGHGRSGHKGQISYVGQLEHDIEDFMKAAAPKQPATLAGFSSGGGFALRIAGSSRQRLFQSYLLLSPFLSPDAPTYRPASGGWVSVGIPRIVGIGLLNRIGIRVFNTLPVVAFALSEEAKSFLTPEYSFALASNFGPDRDYAADIRSAQQPCAVLAGSADEAFHADRFEPVFRALGKDWPVDLLPGIAHIPLITDPAAAAKAIELVATLQSDGTGRQVIERAGRKTK